MFAPFLFVRSPSWLGQSIAPLVSGAFKMPLIYIVLVLLVVGIALWLIDKYVPMAGSIRAILNTVVIVAVCIWVLQAFGLWSRVLQYRVPR
jgi:predicted membrane protein